ncbi:hypothetical protein F0562_014304 [Nyssa sinensis]|uniref:Uncharacterized protein n=1 Tax=Nyssa sinensis TaxID=561372 RepID=A0A5J4ZRG4_9ASTE|nr:hypothetical protein F0562_014304 [Nyssa sinensis]
MRHERQQQPHNRVQKPNRKPLRSELHPGPLVKEYQLRRIIPVGQKHRHLPNYIMHSSRNTEKIHKHCAGKPNLRVMQKGLSGENFFQYKRGTDQQCSQHKHQLFLGNNWGTVDRANDELGFRFDKFGHGLGEAREIAGVHLYRIVLETLGTGAHEADVREGVDAELGEGGLGLLELELAEEEFGLRWGVLVIGDVGGGEDSELRPEFLEAELGLVVELGGVEEDEERERAGRLGRGDEATDEAVCEARVL